MKKLLLFVITLLAFTGVKAQSTFESEFGDTSTVAYNYNSGSPALKVYNRIRTTSGTPARTSIQWRYLSHSFPSGWNPEGFCDNIACYPIATVTSGKWMTMDTVKSFFSDMHLSFLNVGSNGVAIMRIEVRDSLVSGSTRTFTYIATKSPLGITTTVRADDNIKVYPNPATEAINVMDNSNTVKTIGVFNLLGQSISMYHVMGNSARLPLGDTPAGVYFLRMYDAQGKVVATRRFTRQ